MVKIFQGEIVADNDPRLLSNKSTAAPPRASPSSSSSAFASASSSASSASASSSSDAESAPLFGLPTVSFLGHQFPPQHYLAAGLLFMLLGVQGLAIAAVIFFIFLRPKLLQQQQSSGQQQPGQSRQHSAGVNGGYSASSSSSSSSGPSTWASKLGNLASGKSATAPEVRFVFRSLSTLIQSDYIICSLVEYVCQLS
jgi:hypothetical protein